MADESRPLLPHKDIASKSSDGAHDAHEENPKSLDTLSVVIALIGVSLASADDSFMTAIYEPIASYFQKLADGPLLLTAYTLGYCLALPVHGRLSGIYGHEKPLVFAYCLFALGCVLTGTALSIWQAIIGRFISGTGGSGMVALISVMITESATLDQVAVLRSYVNVVSITSRSLGFPLGGLLADSVGWRWSFAGQMPIAMLCCFLTAWRSPSKSSSIKTLESHLHDGSTNTSSIQDLDFLGTGLFVITMTNFLLVFNLGGQRLPWTHPIIVSLAAGCGLSGVAFVLTEAFWAKRPLIPLSFMKTKGVGLFCLVQIFLMGGRYATMIHIAPYFTRILDTTNSLAAACISPSSIGNAMEGFLAGQIISRTYLYKTLSVVALISMCCCYLLVFVRWRVGASLWESLYIFPIGLGFGATLATQFMGLSASTPNDQMATAISVYYLGQEVGVIAGIGISSAILHGVFRSTLVRRLIDSPEKHNIIEGVLRDFRFAGSLPEGIQLIVRSSYLHSFQFAPIISMCSSILALPIILYLRERPLR